MRAKFSTFGLLLLMIAGTSISASATTISFAGLSTAGSGSTSEGNAVTQQGFIFTDLLNGFGNGLVVWQASSANLPGLSTANTSLLEFFAGSTTELTQVGNGAFTLSSIDLAQYNDLQSAGTYSVTFTGTHPDSSIVTQTLTVSRVAGTPALQTFALSNFTNVVKVDFTQGVAVSGTAYQFDNVVVSAVSAVPEPATFSLAALSLAVLLVSKRRRS